MQLDYKFSFPQQSFGMVANYQVYFFSLFDVLYSPRNDLQESCRSS